jgi:thiamine-monophosphate kinase
VPIGEFELIDRWFARLGAKRDDVLLGVGDDAALLRVPDGHELVAAVDTIVEGRHFLPDAHADDVGWRALAVNLSDLAAMGATPAWATLALTLPTVDEDWLDGFAAGFEALASAHGVALVGGDTTRGPLTISVQALGYVEAGRALRRTGAKAGDLVYVTGWPGDAAAGLALQQGRLGSPATARGANRSYLEERFRRPEPRVAFGRRLAGIASACVDVSDGLAFDLGRLARASGVGGVIRAAELPLSRALHAIAGEQRAREFALGGGDDYELLFTVPPERRPQLAQQLGAGAPACHCIGEIVAGKGVRVLGERGELPLPPGFDHFARGP